MDESGGGEGAAESGRHGAADLGGAVALQEAARALLPDAIGGEAVAGRDHLLRVETSGGPAVVRGWPVGAPAERVEATRALLARLAEVGLPVPRPVAPPVGEPPLRRHGWLYEARAFLPGAPVPRAAVAHPAPGEWLDLPASLPPAAFAETIGLLARLHAEGRPPLPLPPAPLAGLPAAVGAAWQDGRARLRSVATRTPHVQRWIAAGERALAAAERVLDAAPPELGAPSAPVHRNAWPAHVLLNREEAVVGLLGWERAGYGVPVLDVAQAIVRLRGWSAEAVEEAVGATSAVAPLAPEARRLLPALGALDLVGVCGRLLVAAYAPEPAMPAAPTALKLAISHVLEGLANATVAIAAGEAKKSGPTRGGPRRRPAPGPSRRRR